METERIIVAKNREASYTDIPDLAPIIIRFQPWSKILATT
jgi:hypothetical protein